MAKRRKLEAPTTEELTKLDAEFRGETSSASPMAPIAQVAASAAAQSPVLSPQARADTAELETYKSMEGQGLVLREIPTELINPTEIFRDRTVLNNTELEELKQSIRANGLRLPIEIYEIPERDGSPYRYGLISGYRRLRAVQQLYAATSDARFGTIKSVVRSSQTTQSSLAAMIEENEVRANVSHYERGRIAALSAQNDFFESLDVAVQALYPVASKAKRSKIRSFARVFEELGDLLEFPEHLTEKRGLAIASALRDGHEAALRKALDDAVSGGPEDEWAALEEVMKSLSDAEHMAKKARGGRPSSKPRMLDKQMTPSGHEIAWGKDKDGYVIRLSGQGIDEESLGNLALSLASILSEKS